MFHGVPLGVEYWAFLKLPIVVAMASQQDVHAALEGGPVAFVAVGAPHAALGAKSAVMALSNALSDGLRRIGRDSQWCDWRPGRH
jgi:malonate transporter MadL subunit